MKDKTVAALFALFLGWMGVHKFYLGQTGAGIIYLLFSWTGIPAIVAFFEFIFLLAMSPASFNARYNRGLGSGAAVSFNMPRYESSRDKAGTLGELKKLYEADVITAEEYEEKRRKILDSI